MSPLTPADGGWGFYRYGGGKTTATVSVSTSGDNTILTPPAGQAVYLFWVSLSSSANNAAEVIATVKLGGTAVYSWNMTLPGAFSHWEPQVGPQNGTLVLNLSAGSIPVIMNYTYTTQ